MSRIKKLASFLLLVSLLLVSLSSGLTSSATPPYNPLYGLPPGSFVPQQLIVGLEDAISISEGDIALANDNVGSSQFLGVTITAIEDLTNVSDIDSPMVINPYDGPQILLLELPTDDLEDMWETILILEENPLVTNAVPNYIDQAFSVTPNDLYFNQLWGLQKIKAPDAWVLTTGNSEVVVGVMDTGVANHVDLNANINRSLGYNYPDPSDTQLYSDSHGTHVAGTVGALGNNSTGVVGVCWDVTIAPYRTDGVHAYFIQALTRAGTYGIQFMNYSMGGYNYNPEVKRAIDNYNGVLIAAAGNEYNDNDGSTPSYPSSYDSVNIVAVAAFTSTDSKASFSNYGAISVDLAAPGVGIWSTLPVNSYASWDGTSMAAPHVSGAFALIKAYAPDLTPKQIKDLLLETVDICPSLVGMVATNGRLNLYTALDSLYKISYNANGGVGEPSSQTKIHGVPLTLSLVEPELSGYTFAGWAFSASATVPDYLPGAAFAVDADTTLYAVWQANATPVSETFQNPYPVGCIPVSLGTAIGVEVLGAYSFHGGNSNVGVAADPLNPNIVILTGLNLGAAPVAAQTSSGILTTVLAYVRDMGNVQSYTFTSGDEGYIAGKYGTLAIPISTVPSGAAGLITWSSLDTSLATVNPATGVITAQADDGYAVILGECRDPWGRYHTLVYRVKIGTGVAPAGAPPVQGVFTHSAASPYPAGCIPVSLGTAMGVEVVGASFFHGGNSNVGVAADPLSPNTVILTGLNLGVAQVAARSSSGVVSTMLAFARDLANVQSCTLANGGEGYIAGINGTLAIPLSVNSGADASRVAWTSLDTSVATVNQATGVVTAKVARGYAVMVGEFTDPWGCPNRVVYRVKIG